jgi:hypothetical protein
MSQLVKTKRQANFKDFKQFGAFKELVEQKKPLYSTRLCVNWTFFGTRGPFKRSVSLTVNNYSYRILNTTFFSSQITFKSLC